MITQPLELDRTTFPGGRADFEIEPTSERDGSMARTHRALAEWFEREGGFEPLPAENELFRLNALLSER